MLTSSNAQNASSVEAIEKSLFLLCLDGTSKGFDRTSDPASRTGSDSFDDVTQIWSSFVVFNDFPCNAFCEAYVFLSQITPDIVIRT